MTEKKCAFCQMPIPDDGIFCSSCGKPVGDVNETEDKCCISCGTKLMPSAKFCSVCGDSQNNDAENDKPLEEKNETVSEETITFTSTAEKSNDNLLDIAEENNPPDNTYIITENLDISIITKEKEKKNIRKKESAWVGVISFLLSIVLILTAITNIVQGTAYNFYSSLNINRLFSSFLGYEEYDLYANLPRNLSSYAKGEDELVNFLNSKPLKDAVEETLNSYILTVASGEPGNLITESRLVEIIKGLEGDIEVMSGYRLSDKDIADIANIVHEDLKYNLLHNPNPNFLENNQGEVTLLQIRNKLDALWSNAPIEAVILRIILLPISNYILMGILGLLLILLIITTKNKLPRLPLLIGIPLFIVSAILLGLTTFIFFIPNIVLNYFGIPANITSVLMGSFLNTTLIATGISVLLSLIVIIVKSKTSGKTIKGERTEDVSQLSS